MQRVIRNQGNEIHREGQAPSWTQLDTSPVLWLLDVKDEEILSVYISESGATEDESAGGFRGGCRCVCAQERKVDCNEHTHALDRRGKIRQDRTVIRHRVICISTEWVRM